MAPYFEHKGIKFREIVEHDLDFLMRLRNDFSTWTCLGDPHVLKAGLQRRWLDGLNQSSDRLYFIAMVDGHDQVGLVRMDAYDMVGRSIRIGTDVSPALRGRGYGKQIFDAMETYAFDYLGLHRVWLLVLDTNARARHLYASRGFKLEGRMRQAVFRGGKWVDYVMMSILEDEYRKRKSSCR